jgi:group I intron endonuclease
MQLCGIYKITNTVTNKIYIGSSSHISRRWNTHKRELSNKTHSNKKLQRAWNKYGSEIFIFSIIEECEKNKLVEKEQNYINMLKPEYNTLKTAYSALGHTLSDEAKQKIREKATGRVFSKETIQKMREAKLGKVSPRKGCKLTQEQIEKTRLAKLGQRHPNRKMGSNDKLTREAILQIHRLGANYKVDNTIKHALATKFNVSDRHIVRILTGKRHREDYYLFHGKYPD